MKHVVVTGGAGFIGSHLVEHLLAADCRVTVIDNFSTGRPSNLVSHPALRCLARPLLEVTAADLEALPQPITGIAHLAALPSVAASWHYPLTAHHNNLSATIHLIELCQALGVPRLVYASSAAVYGNPVHLPIREDQPPAPISPYGLQKWTGESYARLFAAELGFSVVVLRMFNVFGPRQPPDSPYSGVISRFLEAMTAGRPVTIFGDGHQTRDFIHVRDVATAFAQALTVPLNTGQTLVCNLGTGQGLSLLDLVGVLARYFPQWQPTTEFQAGRPGDIRHSQADIAQAMQYLEFQPQRLLTSGLPPADLGLPLVKSSEFSIGPKW
ncbi:MAG: NAD-dependent epimerase/dehydratase family protein [Gloeomargaritaceae cyanobacterium C42_A2020_066]|nr:NAD-dependent epimerase/dehydratase family protein [Gloeomargaritaceae cyanobacterium C42_A2020_066]